jgi:hypothetical protein
MFVFCFNCYIFSCCCQFCCSCVVCLQLAFVVVVNGVIDVSIVVAHIDVSEGAQDVVYDVVSNNVVYFFHVVGTAIVELTLLF